jgi:small conductance mechanosensitive channel
MNSISTTISDYITTTFNLDSALSNIIVMGLTVVLWIFIGILVNRIIKVTIFKSLRVSKKGARAETVARLISNVSRYAVWFVVLIVILAELDIDITPFIASAGVVGLAIGFGAQEIVRDFISGFFIIFDGEFNIGDVVESDGFKGNVKTIGLRTTVLVNWKGETKIINNGNLGNIINYSTNKSVAIVDFGVSYDTDLEKVSELMKTFVDEVEGKYEDIVEKPVFLGVTELAGSSINLRIIAKTNTLKHFQIERNIRKDIVKYLGENDIEIPFPQVVVHNAQDFS